jgi:hypothetical protein
MTITVEGLPPDLSTEGRDALSASPAPVPLNMFDPAGQLTLVHRGGGWLVCGPLGIRGA